MTERIYSFNILKKLILPLLLFTFSITKAQVFGGNPPAIKWQQINTPAARIIFPAGLDTAGQKVANTVQQINRHVQPTIGYAKKQVNIVLQNQTIVANGYVGLAPFRSEFFLTPEQNSFDIGSLPWPQQLAIHEFRHVQQYNNFNVGISHVLLILFGEGGQALGNDLAIPNWFFEGDAVFNETLVSRQGRGRLPFFFNGYRALWEADKNYSYMKLRNGSYRDYIPDHYPIGYMLVAYGRQKYGDDVWKNITHAAAAYTGGFYPFQRAVKKYTGIDFKTFTSQGLNYFKNEFKTDKKPAASVGKHFDADREYPAYVNDSTLIYMKSDYDHIPAFFIKAGDLERKISNRSVSIDDHFAYHNGKIIYAAYNPDIRWGYRNYSELMLLDIATGAEHCITQKTKYFSPAFSADGKTIAVVQVAPSGASHLHLLDTTGKLIKIVPNPQKLFYTYPQFYDDNKLLAAVRNAAGEMSLAIIDATNGTSQYLLPFSYQPIGFIAIKKDTAYFTATNGINDKLYAIIINSHRLYELQTDEPDTGIGNYQAAIGNNKLAWVSFTAYGYHINQADIRRLHWKAISSAGMPAGLPDMGISALKRDSSADMVDKVVDKPWPVTSYSKGHGLFNFHSLIPNISDPNYSLAITGENILNTFQSQLSFNYNANEGYKQFGFEAIYGALFPYISGGVDYTIDRRGIKSGNYIYWNETQVHGGLEVPLNFSRNMHLTSLAFGSDLYFNNTSFQHATAGNLANRSYTYLNNYISFNNQVQQAKKNIYPQLAQSISINYKNAISGVGSTQFLATGTFYFPGLFVNHSIAISAAHQQKSKNNDISFSNNFPFSRGYNAQSLDVMNKIGITYHLPLAYPDAGWANTIYLLRLRGALFFDYTYATSDNYYKDGSNLKQNFRSVGGTLYFDTKFFNQSNITFGLRYSRLLDSDLGLAGHNRIELVLPVSFF